MDGRLQTDYPRWFTAGKPKNYYIEKERAEIDKYWNDLIYVVCDGKVSEMKELRKYDIKDFFSYVDNKIKPNGK